MTTIVLQVRPVHDGTLVTALEDSGLVLADYWHTRKAEAVRRAQVGMETRFGEVAFRLEHVDNGEGRL